MSVVPPRRHRTWADDTGPDRLHVFVPSIVGAGLLASILFLVGDAASRLAGGRGGERRQALLARSVAADLGDRAGAATPTPAASGVRSQELYVVVAAALVSVGLYGIVGSFWNYWNPVHPWNHIGWLWVTWALASLVLLWGGVAAGAIAFRHPLAPPFARPLLLWTPLGGRGVGRPSMLTAAREELIGGVPRPSSVLLRNGWLLLAVALAAATLGTLAATAHGTLLAIDRPLSDAVRGEGFEGAFRAITRLGSAERGIWLAFLAAVALWRRCRALALAYPAAVLAAVAVDVVLKVVVDRPRPADAVIGTALGSFPSGHVLHAVVMFGLLPPAVWILWRRKLLFWVAVPVAAAAVAGVAYSRMYLGAHWPTDVTASLLIGATLLLAAEYVVASPPARRHCAGCALHGGGAVSRPGAGVWRRPPR